ncbi:MFS transporter, NNP family, nitrate/nitrite transporter [Thalassobacillus cyri]|uniref:Nitrate/nitrite transporter n=1 Tax=Thalassobacillus cyri TaxID=571932 RepID=A0A1H4F4F0_9BACI|nr:NarK family nitrate/nitrite MFS transporter [Thalassobacillus cyri]SEA92153.1 MFS transporter, NNP family, nitrate/nitrite transporter [Thalassobacillus cyri]
MGEEKIYKGNMKILFMTTFAFFLSFFVWFNMAPFVSTIRDSLRLTTEEIGILLSINVALTIPARIVIGMLVDRFGPKNVYTILLLIISIPCFWFALADSFWQLFIARAFLSVVGAGFVIGIRMVSEWFPPRQLGLAEGVYGGWGNFGSAAAAFTLPSIALLIGGENGWRYAIALTGVLCIVYAFFYYRSVENTPPGKQYQRPNRNGAMEVTSYKSMFGLILMSIPLYAALALITWQLSLTSLIPTAAAGITYIILALTYLYNVYKIWSVNRKHLKAGVPKEEQYSFKQVVILDFAYAITFGSELAVISMLPMFFEETFSISTAQAGMVASSFAFMNLVARPGGGWLSDKFGRKKTLLILLVCVSGAYVGMSQIETSWPIFASIALTMTCSFFVQAGEGAVFSMVPLVKKRVTGQVAGMVGAYGNVGAVLFLAVLGFLNPSLFFMFIAGSAFFCFLACWFLEEPCASRESRKENIKVEKSGKSKEEVAYN